MTKPKLLILLLMPAIVASLFFYTQHAHAAVGVNGHLKYFGYWDNAGGDPYSYEELFVEHASYTNVTMRTYQYRSQTGLQGSPDANGLLMVDDWEGLKKAHDAGLKIVLGWQFFDLIDVNKSMDPGLFASWVQVITPYINDVVAINIADEPDCNYGVGLNGWSPSTCKAMRLKIEANIAKMKSAFPNTPAWVNYTSAFIKGLALSGQEYKIPTNADWISFDCYTPWTGCYDTLSVPDILGRLTDKLGANQWAVFIPPAFYNGFGLVESQISPLADQYYNLAVSDPKVIGIFPFIWRQVAGTAWVPAHDSPTIGAKYAQIGCLIKGTTCGSYIQPPYGQSLIGVIDGSNCTSISGWALDKNTPSTSIDVQIYNGLAGFGGVLVGTYPTNIFRSDVNAAHASFGVTGNHGFSILTPAALKDGVTRTNIYIYTVKSNGTGLGPSVSGTPLTFSCGSATPQPPKSGDYNGDGKTDIAVWRPSNGTWYISGGATTQWGGAGDIPVPGDYDGDRKTDLAVFRPGNLTWYVLNSSTATGAATQWGVSGDIPVPGDYNGDGKTDIAVWRPSNGTWYISGGATNQWGSIGDIPVPGDYDGDGKTDIATFRSSVNTWYIYNSSTGTGNATPFGTAGDILIPGDYNGDRKTDVAVYRPSNGTWYISGVATTQWGISGDIPVPGDYNGDGKTDPTIWRPSDMKWYAYSISTLGPYGGAGDIHVSNYFPNGVKPTGAQAIVGDINLDHIINSLDFSILNSKWFTNDAASDLNHDGLVNSIDSSIINSNWFRTW